MKRTISIFTATAALLFWTAASAHAQQAPKNLSDDAACKSMTPTSMGGPSPQRATTLVLRYLGTSDYELAFHNTVLLFNAFYVQGPRTSPLGFKQEDIKRADALLLGHAHFDHIANAQFLAERLGVKLYGGPPTINYLQSVHVPQQQLVLWKGTSPEDTAKIGDLTVQGVLGHHAVLPPTEAKASAAYQQLVNATERPLTAEEQKQMQDARGRGTFDPSVITEGTIAYLVTFPNNFHLVFQDSAGPVTDWETAMMQKIGRADIALVAYQGFFLPAAQIKATMPLIRAFKPRIFLPNHQDETAGSWPYLASYPLFMAIRDEMPDTVTIDPLYRSPICIDTNTRDVFVGPYGY